MEFPAVAENRPSLRVYVPSAADDVVVAAMLQGDRQTRDATGKFVPHLHCPRAILDSLHSTKAQLRLARLVTVDVGAHIGSCLLEFAARGHKVYAFEPMRRNIEMIRHSVALNGLNRHVILIEAGAADKAGEFTLYAQVGNSGNNVVASEGSTPDHFGRSADQWKTETIRTVALDDIISEHVHVMKIDVQGHELRVLLGASRLFTVFGVRTLLMEFSPGTMRAKGDDPAEIFTTLYKYGYVCSGMTYMDTPDKWEAYIKIFKEPWGFVDLSCGPKDMSVWDTRQQQMQALLSSTAKI